MLTDHAIIPPFGVAGGYSGAANRFVVVRDGEIIEPSPVPGKVGGFPLLKGDIVRMESSGGGGYGDPLKREPDRVRRDVHLGYVNAERARSRYGVVLDAAGAVDDTATELERARVRGARLRLAAVPVNEDEADGPRRRVTLSRDRADRLGVAEGDLIELTASKSAAALRGWVHIAADRETGEELQLGPLGIAALGAKPGEEIELRRVEATAI